MFFNKAAKTAQSQMRRIPDKHSTIEYNDPAPSGGNNHKSLISNYIKPKASLSTRRSQTMLHHH
jgi:hypothetical protein